MVWMPEGRMSVINRSDQTRCHAASGGLVCTNEYLIIGADGEVGIPLNSCSRQGGPVEGRTTVSSTSECTDRTEIHQR